MTFDNLIRLIHCTIMIYINYFIKKERLEIDCNAYAGYSDSGLKTYVKLP